MRNTKRSAAALPLLALLVLAAPVAAQDGPAVTEIAVCLDVDREARAPSGAAEVFEAGVERLYCFTRIQGAAAPAAVEHVWYRGGETVARVDLKVGSKDWRTWSSKRIKSDWTGDWQVKVLDGAGLVLASTSFRIEAPAAGEGE